MLSNHIPVNKAFLIYTCNSYRVESKIASPKFNLWLNSESLVRFLQLRSFSTSSWNITLSTKQTGPKILKAYLDIFKYKN